VVINPKRLKRFETQILKAAGRLSLRHRLQIYRAMWMEAKKFGSLRSKNPLAGIEKDIQMAKVLNSCSKKF